MRTAREKVDLATLNIQGLIPRRAQTGALILEVPGPEEALKGDALASNCKLRELLTGEGIRIVRPTKTAEIRIRGVDNGASKEEVLMSVAEAGGCDIMDVRMGELRPTPDGMRSALVRCSINAAIAHKIAGLRRLKIGWMLTKVELLSSRADDLNRVMSYPGTRVLDHYLT